MEEIKKLARTIVGYSLNVKKNEKVLITCQSLEARSLLEELIIEITNAGGIPFLSLTDARLGSMLTERTTSERIKLMKKIKEFEVDNFDSFISIHYRVNDYENKKITPEITKEISKALLKSQDTRVNKRKWVLLNYPSVLDSYKAKMTIKDFYEHAFSVMNVDYAKMRREIEPLKKLMEKTDKVRITGPNTDISFSIKGMPIIPCCGEMNIPDGEIYTAPLKTSVNGTITYNVPSPYQGEIFNDISLTFKEGKIISCKCSNNQEKLESIFNTDEGSRYIGEFSLGLNPKILHPIGDILFDEKILGSLHFTPGRCYKDSDNVNVSAIHWDLVLIQREDYGGGEIYFDDKLIRKNGKFVLSELEHLN